jgi:hypothetical protein
MIPDTHGVAVGDTFNNIVACIDMDPEEITYNALLALIEGIGGGVTDEQLQTVFQAWSDESTIQLKIHVNREVSKSCSSPTK